jgi:hypothetical protein
MPQAATIPQIRRYHADACQRARGFYRSLKWRLSNIRPKSVAIQVFNRESLVPAFSKNAHIRS